MPTVVLAALLLGDLNVGAGSAGRSLGVPSQLGDVMEATILLVTVGVLVYWRLRRKPVTVEEAEPELEEVDTS